MNAIRDFFRTLRLLAHERFSLCTDNELIRPAELLHFGAFDIGRVKRRTNFRGIGRLLEF